MKITTGYCTFGGSNFITAIIVIIVVFALAIIAIGNPLVPFPLLYPLFPSFYSSLFLFLATLPPCHLGLWDFQSNNSVMNLACHAVG